MDYAFKYAETHAMVTEEKYPYTSGRGKTGKCNKSKATGGVVRVTNFHDVKSKDVSAMKAALSKQPVSVAIEADKMAF